MRLGLAICAAVCASALQASAQPSAPTLRVEVPIREVVLSDGEHRYAVPITVGGVAIEAGLDSGSTGLRILPNVVPAAAQVPGRRTSYSYDSGTQFDGVVAEADMTIGVSGRAKFEQIQKVGCRWGLRDCPAAKVSSEQFGIQGSGLPNEGFKAILGINMGVDDSPNPLMQMGVRRWIIDLPRPGEGKPGRLVLNPTDAEVSGYTPLRIDDQFSDRRGGLHDAVSGCIVNQQTKRSYCGPTDLDTGAPGVVVTTAGAADAWRPGTPATMAFFDKGKAVLGADFVVGQGPGTTMRVRPQPRAPATDVYLGILPYFAFSALYDPEAKTLALKAREGP